MIEVYDEYEKQHVMINVSKIRIVYNGKYTKKTMIQVDGLDYDIETRESYEDIKYKLAGLVNVR